MNSRRIRYHICFICREHFPSFEGHVYVILRTECGWDTVIATLVNPSAETPFFARIPSDLSPARVSQQQRDWHTRNDGFVRRLIFSSFFRCLLINPYVLEYFITLR